MVAQEEAFLEIPKIQRCNRHHFREARASSDYSVEGDVEVVATLAVGWAQPVADHRAGLQQASGKRTQANKISVSPLQAAVAVSLENHLVPHDDIKINHR